MKKRKLLLISPRRTLVTYDDLQENMQFITKKRESLLIASLATIAALTPPAFEVKIIDEHITPVDFEEPCDLVGLSSFPYQLTRAAAIAGEFSRRGVPVVCGGSAVTLSPDKWRAFADVLIIGEAEQIWSRFLGDFCTGTYHKEYREEQKIDPALTPVPDYRGYAQHTLGLYLAGIVQTSRGCPYNCEFCDAIVYMGRKTRYKPLENILKEVEQIRQIGTMRYILLADDNFSAHPAKAKAILAALKAWNSKQRKPFSFFTQLSIEIAGDDEFLKLAAEAGMTRVFTGIETPHPASLEECRKYPNLQTDLLPAVANFHKYGIQVISGCILGFDHDDLSIFRKQFAFFMQSGIPLVRVAPLQVLDGTPLKSRMQKEGRYIPAADRKSVSADNSSELDVLSFIPGQLTALQLTQGIYWLLRELYKPDNFLIRFRTFFENFEKSTEKHRLKIPPGYAGLAEAAMTGRLGFYLVSRREEKKLFRNMLYCTLRSSHPRRFQILMENFLEFLNMRELLLKINPGIQSVCYPV